MSWERWRDWLDDAEDDLAAEALYQLGRYAKACFLAQQAAEKALKALLIKNTVGTREHTACCRLPRRRGLLGRWSRQGRC
ncbi:MAG: HEPN domain-containing protein [Pyrobaculum sp.]